MYTSRMTSEDHRFTLISISGYYIMDKTTIWIPHFSLAPSLQYWLPLLVFYSVFCVFQVTEKCDNVTNYPCVNGICQPESTPYEGVVSTVTAYLLAGFPQRLENDNGHGTCKIGQKSWNFVISHGILQVFPLICTKLVFLPPLRN